MILGGNAKEATEATSFFLTEVQDVAYLAMRQIDVIEGLGDMLVCDGTYRLEFDDYLTIHIQVSDIFANDMSFIRDRKGFLPFKGYSQLFQLYAERILIHFLCQALTQYFHYIKVGFQQSTCQRFIQQHNPFL